MTQKDKIDVRNEIDINDKLSKCQRHPNILKMFGFWETKQKVYMLFEHANQGDLFGYVQHHKLDGINKARIVLEIISAMKYMHDKGIIHYDLKPENIFLNQGKTLHVLVADFGLSVDQMHRRRYMNKCTLEYTAPEQVHLDRLPENLEAIDSWCMGILLYEFSHGLTPFSGMSREKVLERVTQPFACKNKDYESAILNLTQQSPSRRMNSSELYDFFSLEF